MCAGVSAFVFMSTFVLHMSIQCVCMRLCTRACIGMCVCALQRACVHSVCVLQCACACMPVCKYTRKRERTGLSFITHVCLEQSTCCIFHTHSTGELTSTVLMISSFNHTVPLVNNTIQQWNVNSTLVSKATGMCVEHYTYIHT